jgi:DNA-binding LytR/AlgR family response regulator
MKTIIIEDEPLVAKDLQKLICQIDSSIEIITILDSLEMCIAYFKSHSVPDLIFMDIQLNDGVSFDLLKHVDIDCPIIFTTAYSEYAIRAFKVNGIEYLLKPIDKTELRGAIDKFNKTRVSHGKELTTQISLMMNQLAALREDKLYKDRFIVHSGKSHCVVEYSKIAYFIKDTLIYLVTNDKQQFVTDFQTMDEIEDLLNPKFFYRANRQFIININAVESFKTDQYSKIVLQLKKPLGIALDISREKAQTFKAWIQ